MRLGRIVGGFGELLALPRDRPELLLAQYSSLATLIPTAYFVVMVNSWTLAFSFLHRAPLWLTISCPAMLSVACAFRLRMWWRRRGATAVAADEVVRVLSATARVAWGMSVAFAGWVALLFPYGDAYTRSHIIFYLGMSMVGCVACLMHLRPAALALTLVPSCCMFLACCFYANPTLVLMSVNAVLVAAAVVVVMIIQNGYFNRMVVARSDAMALLAENRSREQKEIEAENRIRQLARCDTLTGLANRATFREQLSAGLELSGQELALLFIDLDGFKIVNDTNGHMVGDALLCQVADRLRRNCAYPGITVGRLGGDEFAVVVERCPIHHAVALAGDLVDTLTAPYRMADGRQLLIGASIGVVHAPSCGRDAETLLLRADIALYAAKAAGKGTFMVFAPQMEARIQERVSLEASLRSALQSQMDLLVFYQPILDIGTGQVTTREALLRWFNPERGWIAPSEFIAVAEDCGLIDQLGELVLRRACQDAMGWQDGARVAVNVSPKQLSKGTLEPLVRTVLSATGLPADRLELEITENALLDGALDGLSELRKLRQIGVRVAIDDFGTGFSSLAHLRAFPFDKIKIDGSFVRDAVPRPDCAAVVHAIADLGKRLGVITVAEGVETEAHLARVTEEGCTEVQGYLLGRPMPDARDSERVAAINRFIHELAPPEAATA